MQKRSKLLSKRAAGTKVGNKRQLIVRVDDDTFEEIAELAAAENVSVAEQIRVLIEFGLESVKEV